MIVGLKGNIEYKEPTFVHVEVNGVVYEVFISLQTFAALPKNEVKLFISQIVREDALLLFGFFYNVLKSLAKTLWDYASLPNAEKSSHLTTREDKRLRRKNIF